MANPMPDAFERAVAMADLWRCEECGELRSPWDRPVLREIVERMASEPSGYRVRGVYICPSCDPMGAS